MLTIYFSQGNDQDVVVVVTHFRFNAIKELSPIGGERLNAAVFVIVIYVFTLALAK